jgi:hypothetical protein
MNVRNPAGDEARMSEAQARELKQLSESAYEPEAFRSDLSAPEAARRIAALKAKLPLLDAPPHTL